MTITKPTEIHLRSEAMLQDDKLSRAFPLGFSSRKMAKRFMRAFVKHNPARSFRLITPDKAQGSIRQWPRST